MKITFDYQNDNGRWGVAKSVIDVFNWYQAELTNYYKLFMTRKNDSDWSVNTRKKLACHNSAYSQPVISVAP